MYHDAGNTLKAHNKYGFRTFFRCCPSSISYRVLSLYAEQETWSETLNVLNAGCPWFGSVLRRRTQLFIIIIHNEAWRLSYLIEFSCETVWKIPCTKNQLKSTQKTKLLANAIFRILSIGTEEFKIKIYSINFIL